MHPLSARALRRAGLVGTAMAVTLMGHALAAGHLAAVRVAPAAWLGIIAVATLLSALRRGRAFSEWSPGRVLAALLVTQAGLHVVLHAAPWVFGLVPHHATPLVSSTTVSVHVCAALLLWGPLCWGQRVLARAARLVRALVARPRPRALPRPARAVGRPLWVPHRRDHNRPRSSRGPPAWPLARPEAVAR
ncbi:MAG: hypothetical protein U0Y82_11725 [Thermoleophilia bacterium]